MIEQICRDYFNNEDPVVCEIQIADTPNSSNSESIQNFTIMDYKSRNSIIVIDPVLIPEYYDTFIDSIQQTFINKVRLDLIESVRSIYYLNETSSHGCGKIYSIINFHENMNISFIQRYFWEFNLYQNLVYDEDQNFLPKKSFYGDYHNQQLRISALASLEKAQNYLIL